MNEYWSLNNHWYINRNEKKLMQPIHLSLMPFSPRRQLQYYGFIVVSDEVITSSFTLLGSIFTVVLTISSKYWFVKYESINSFWRDTTIFFSYCLMHYLRTWASTLSFKITDKRKFIACNTKCWYKRWRRRNVKKLNTFRKLFCGLRKIIYIIALTLKLNG